jgi:hypothetical protein
MKKDFKFEKQSLIDDLECEVERVSDITIDRILKIIKDHNCKEVFYMGSADKNLVIAIKEICSICLSDWSDHTNKGAHFWWNEEEDGPYVNCPPIPDWAIDVPVQVEGVPKHDVFLLDILMKGNDYLDYVNQAQIVILFGKAKLDEFTHKDLYEWNEGEISVGLLKPGKQVEQRHYEEMVIDGRKILMHLNEENDSISISFAV